jgi:TPR repeat protein
MKYILIAATVIALSGCTGSDNKTRDANSPEARLERARAGDIEAQYLVGKELCCTSDRGPSSKTQQATEWLCLAARRDYGPAQFFLGEIYSGAEVSKRSFLGRLVTSSRAPKPRTDLAAMWFDLAIANGIKDAVERRFELAKTMTPKDDVAVARMRAVWRTAPCEWKDVYGD